MPVRFGAMFRLSETTTYMIVTKLAIYPPEDLQWL